MFRVLFLSLMFTCAWIEFAPAHEIAKEMADAARVFVNSLNDQQKEALQFPMDDSLRKDWQFIPMERKGLGLKSMKPHQRGLAMALIQTVLSHKGFASTMQIMALEDVLRQMENNPVKRDPEKYHLFLFGSPGTKGSWGWRIEGHHLSISVTIVAEKSGQTIAISPSFFGTNPAEVRMGPLNGTRVLGKIEDGARSLAKSLTVEQKKNGILEVKVPRDVLLGPGKSAKHLSPKGITASEMTEPQVTALDELVNAYLTHFRTEVAKKELSKLKSTKPQEISFAWIGKLRPGQPHYFRIQGPTFVMEYDNTQNKANHAHLVWRDLENDFGEDALKRHLQLEHSK